MSAPNCSCDTYNSTGGKNMCSTAGELNITIRQLRTEIEALKQQVEQGKRDAVPEDIRKDAESWRAYKKRKDEVIAAGMGKKILRDAAAPKQEKGNARTNDTCRSCDGYCRESRNH